MKNCLPSVFGVSPSETAEGLCDLIRTQWRVDQTELIPEDWYKNRSEESVPSSLRTQHSYWESALSVCMMELISTAFESYCGMDEFWQKVGTMADSEGSLKYSQLFVLTKCVLSRSHGNAVPERSFSMKKILL